MATYTTNVIADNSPISVGTGSFSTAGPSSVLNMTPSVVQLMEPGFGYADYFGSFAYTYSAGFQYLSWPGSTLTGITTYDLNRVMLDTIYGLSIPGSVYETFAINNDVVGLVAYFFSGNDTITGSAFNDVLWGYAGNDVINGGGSNDVLDGGAGNDVVNGGLGVNSLAGGLGDDVFIVDNSQDVVIENLGEGVDTVKSSITYTLGGNVERLTLTGAVAINGSGNALNNILLGNAANNVLDGGLGADRMTGGLGDDTYIVDNAGDVVAETSALVTEIDTVKSSISHVLGANLENLTLTGIAAINGTGNSLANELIGNSVANTLNGGEGYDTLYGGGGNDTLIGGLGVDTYFGGAGDDTYVVDETLQGNNVFTVNGQPGEAITNGRS